ncbi:MAG TPA: phytoene/squalene synthase family protein [Silvibacterium sp.]|nr:phytoene/squalene synthase family protein [Silvibacterium sp.]
MTVAEAYEYCRKIARREARNFYYAFVALPKHKRDAICAVYAFMRHADDISDDETLTPEQRRAKLKARMDAWGRARDSDATEEPVFIALRDAQARFGIPSELLDKLVEGTAMDLRRDASANLSGELDTYATFEDLYRYCYLVASVVGLVCIRIFGYRDARAEKLAEETGIAFQLTNILRDVREDAERGRVYLPLDDLGRYGVSLEDLTAGHAKVTPRERELLQSIAQRAERYYASGYALLPLIDADSRPALWVLITIYHRLLKEIERSGYEVFAKRASVSTLTKSLILTRGLGQVLRHRLRGAE